MNYSIAVIHQYMDRIVLDKAQAVWLFNRITDCSLYNVLEYETWNHGIFIFLKFFTAQKVWDRLLLTVKENEIMVDN